jgi:hypothetical protein
MAHGEGVPSHQRPGSVYTVLREGVSQRDERGRLVECAVGSEIRVGDSMAKVLLASGHIAPSSPGRPRRRDEASQ